MLAILFALNLELARAAAKQVGVTTIYDPAYVQLRYPGGDLPPERGVCADVIIRAFRNVGVDLQREVHEDMRAHFDAYPKMWGLRAPDANIDHRRRTAASSVPPRSSCSPTRIRRPARRAT